MSDGLTREFKALLGTTMESVLNRAMFEIMRIFENSLHDHQLELAHKGEEVVQLKIKLQRAEIRLRDAGFEEDKDMGMNLSQRSETQQQPEDVQNVSVQTAAEPEPESDIEVPDDWCAPLGCETVPKQEDGVCPSVRLKKLSIPLWHIPIKKEMTGQKNDSQQQTKGPRRSKRGSSSNNQDRSLLEHKKVLPPKIRGDINKLLNQNATIVVLGPRRSGKTYTGRRQETTMKTRKEARESAATKSEPATKETVKEDKNEIHTCSHCKKEFDSDIGRKLHERFHRWCRSCKRFFPSPSMLITHKPLCGAKELRKSSMEKHQKKLKGTTPTQKNMMPSTKMAPMRYHCLHCSAKFIKHSTLKRHMFSHTCEKLFPCTICPKRFRVESSLKVHMTRMHRIQENSGDTGGDLSWTEPLEVADDLTSANEASAPANQLNLTQNFQCSTGLSAKWKECGTLGPKGFVCNVCLVVKKSKIHLVEHYCIHTGEKPYRCMKCNARFRFQGQMIAHTKQCSHVPQV